MLPGKEGIIAFDFLEGLSGVHAAFWDKIRHLKSMHWRIGLKGRKILDLNPF